MPPLSTSGGNTMLTRLPSASRASTIGLASSMRRPIARGDALRDVDQMLGVAKPGVGLFELAVPLDIDVERPVHQDVGDFVVIEEGFERPQPDHVVGQLGGERALLDLVQLYPLLGRDLADQLRDFGPQRQPRDAAGYRRIDPRHQNGADLLFELAATRKILGSDLAAVPGTRTSSRPPGSTTRRPKPADIISRYSTSDAARAVAPKARAREWQSHR